MKNKRLVILFSVFLLAILMRIINFDNIFVDGNVIFRDFDSYYHMRRIVSTTFDFPHVISFDSYIDYPNGKVIHWPPLYDLIIAFIALLVGLGSPSIHTIESIGALFPVFLGAFTVFPVYFISKEIFDDKVGILAALIFALTPAHIYVSYLGKPDHHVAEAFFSLMAFLFFLVALKNYENKMIWKSHLSSIISGLMMGSIILIWPGSPMFVGIFVIFATSQFVINQRRERPSNSLMIAGVAVFFVTLIMIALGGSDRFEMIMISLTAFLFFVLGSLSNFMRDRHINWFCYLLSLTVMALTLLFTMPLLMPQFYRGFTSGFGFLGRSGDALSTVAESMPLFFIKGEFSLINVTYNFGFSFYIAVIALIILFALILKEEEAFEINQTFFLVWTIVLLVTTLQQSRFSHILSINIAILCSYLFFKSKEKMKPSKKRSFILFMMIFLVIVPSLAIGTVMSLYDRSPSDEWYDSLVWMRENTPVTSYYDDPLEKPEYGVMSWWDYGNWIVYIAERPPIANNFLTGIDDSAHFFTTEDEEVASEILDDREARYVISDFEMGLYNRPVLGGLFISSGKFDSIAKLAGEDATRYYNLNRTPNSDFYNTMYARLHLFDGSNGKTPLNDTVIALGNYRLIYESRTGYESPQGEIKEVKIFEYLQGAKIIGVTVPNTDITISTEVTTDQNRTFNYSKSVTSDEDGSFEFIVPYSTDGNPFNTRLSSPYEIVTNDLSAIVNVTEEEVKNGATVTVELL